MMKLRWWLFMLWSVGLLGSAWLVARRTYQGQNNQTASPTPPATIWIAAPGGPAAADPYQHVLEITGWFNSGCGGSICFPGAGEMVLVSWHLQTLPPSSGSLPNPLPELVGKICQEGTWNNPLSERCTDPFEIKLGDIYRSEAMPPRLEVLAQAPIGAAYSSIHIELMVGAKPSNSVTKTAMASRAQASFNIVP